MNRLSELRRTSRCPGSRAAAVTFACAVLVAIALAGCATPNKANIELRKQNQELQRRIDKLEQQNRVAAAQIAGFEAQHQTLPTLPQRRLDELFTVHDVKIGRYSGGADLDVDHAGDEGFKLYLTPQDKLGRPLKASGEIFAQAFDLTGSEPQLLGECHLTPQRAKQAWRELGPFYAFVVECPWKTLPTQPNVTLRFRFVDALTGRIFTGSREAKIIPPISPATRPATHPTP